MDLQFCYRVVNEMLRAFSSPASPVPVNIAQYIRPKVIFSGSIICVRSKLCCDASVVKESTIGTVPARQCQIDETTHIPDIGSYNVDG